MTSHNGHQLSLVVVGQQVVQSIADRMVVQRASQRLTDAGQIALNLALLAFVQLAPAGRYTLRLLILL